MCRGYLVGRVTRARMMLGRAAPAPLRASSRGQSARGGRLACVLLGKAARMVS